MKTFAIITLLGVAVSAQQDFDADAYLKQKEDEYRDRIQHKKLNTQQGCDYAFEIFDLNHDGKLDRDRELPLMFNEGAKFLSEYAE